MIQQPDYSFAFTDSSNEPIEEDQEEVDTLESWSDDDEIPEFEDMSDPYED